jgi:prepilin-type processing-associated H-X9-DG protein
MTRYYFTIFELLIVIAIIVVLASLLLPALSTARGKAKSISCVSNLKQFGIAQSQYANANNDYITPLNNLSYYGTGNAGNWWYDLLLNYLSEPNTVSGIWVCPESVLFNWGGGYGMLMNNDHGVFYGSSQLLTKYRKASRRLLMSDTWRASDHSTHVCTTCPTCLWWMPGGTHPEIATRHGKKCNVLYVDGHVEAKTGDLMRKNNDNIFGHGKEL